MDSYYVVFDAGTQSVKVAVYSFAGKCVAAATAKTSLQYPRPGWVEMDIDEYYRSVKKCMRICSDRMRADGLSTAAVVAIMGDGIICGIAGINEEGKPVTPYINYLDSRTAADVARLKAENRSIWARETGNAEPNVMFPAMIARWFLAHTEFVKTGVKFIHNCPYILLHLAGLRGTEAFIDWGTLSGWGLGYKVAAKEWSPAQLQILGIDRTYLPRIVKPWEHIGRLCAADAAETGFPEGIPICAGAGDTMQSMLGSGVWKAGQAADVAGTCAMFCVAVPGIIPALSQRGSGFVFNAGTLADTYFYWGTVRTGGLALRWFKDAVCRQEANESYYRTLDELAQAYPPGCNGALFFPYLTGNSTSRPYVRGTFTGLTLEANQGALWRCVLEGIGYDYREIMAQCRQADIKINGVTVTEGGSRDALWNQIKADMLETTVYTLAEAGGAMPTNAVIAAYSAGHISDVRGPLQERIRLRHTFLPRENAVRLYKKQYERRCRLLTALNEGEKAARRYDESSY